MLGTEFFHTFYGIKKSLPEAYEILSHSDDRLAYQLSKLNTHDDSLFIQRYSQAIVEAKIFDPSLHAFIYGTTEARDIRKRVYCEVLLAHALTAADSAFVHQTMLPPFRHTSEYGFRKEFRRRVNLVKGHLNIQ